MKKFIFIHGPNGVGKSAVSEKLHKSIINSAWLESEWVRCVNPFSLDDEMSLMTEKNMSFILRNYLVSSKIDVIILNWGLHGKRKSIIEKIMNNLSDLEFEYYPVIITCSEEENIKRMKKDNRDEDRIKRALDNRSVYENLKTFQIDSTFLEVDEVINMIMDHIGLNDTKTVMNI